MTSWFKLMFYQHLSTTTVSIIVIWVGDTPTAWVSLEWRSRVSLLAVPTWNSRIGLISSRIVKGCGRYNYWLVVSTPLKNMKVNWMIIPNIINIWKNEKYSKPPASIILCKRHGAWCFKRSEKAEILMPLTLVAQIFTLDTWDLWLSCNKISWG